MRLHFIKYKCNKAFLPILEMTYLCRKQKSNEQKSYPYDFRWLGEIS